MTFHPRQHPNRVQGAAAVQLEKALLGGGSFWAVEARLADLHGVRDTVVGYAGGTLEHPTYREVCTERTGHAEVVEVTFDPGRLCYCQLLDAFFAFHDPTTPNRQGPDWGSQYRSVVFALTADQAYAAHRKIAELNAAGAYRQPVVTEVCTAPRFWKAEEYHQRYLEKRGMVGCSI